MWKQTWDKPMATETNQYARPSLQGRKADVTPKQEELLVRLMEECAELQVECAKILRWGWGSFNPDNVGRGTNEENFHREAGDVGKLYDQLSRLRNP
jgi:hypothetical protein